MAFRKLKAIQLTLVFSFCFFRTINCQTYDDCIPSEACRTQSAAGSLVPDPLDCTRYYVCIGDSPFLYATDNSLPCPTDNYFDYSVGACVPDNGEECVNPCDKGPNLECIRNCTVDVDITGDPNNCNNYFLCLPSGPTLLTCGNAPDLYFDGAFCQNDVTKCCAMCEAYCDELFVQIDDPKDCTKFYICLELGLITGNEDYHSQCPEDEYFNRDAGVCLPGSCVNYCD